MKQPDLWSIVHLLRREARDRGLIEGLSVPEREATLFAYALENLPIGIEPGESLAGDFGAQYLSPQACAGLASRIAQAATRDAAQSTTGDPFRLLDEHFHCRAGYTPAHTCADYQRIVERGVEGLLAEIAAASEQASADQLATHRGMKIALNAVVAWAGRYAVLARETAQSEDDGTTRGRLELIAKSCDRVPRRPATTFHEAVQSVWLVHAAIGLSELSGSSLSLGRADQYLYPLFRADTERGISMDALEQSVRDLWLKLNRFGDPACAVNLGGADEDDDDLFNPLSAMMVRVTRDLKLPSPILAARVHRELPAQTFDSLIDPELFAMGQPTFYGEAPCRKAMVRRGVPEADARRFAANSCMGLVVPGEEISDMWGAVANLLLPLELTLNHGEPFQHELPIDIQTPPLEGACSFEGLLAQFEAYLDEIVSLLVRRNWEAAQRVGTERPNPFLSALTQACIERGRDRALGGARYHIVIVEGFGWANAADSLTATKRLVFDERRFALDYLASAARRNFGDDTDMLAAILECPKYGNADTEADAMARHVAQTFAQCVSRHSRDGVYCTPSFHTLNAHVRAGCKLAASLDGRRAGEALGKNAGPMLGRSRNGLTSLLLSASAIDQPALSGGQALDISVDPRTIATSDGKRKFGSLLQTYFDRGGLQIQVNGVSADRLRAAIADPQAHSDLIVKIAGYSARFVSLGRDIQEEMVERFAQGL